MVIMWPLAVSQIFYKFLGPCERRRWEGIDGLCFYFFLELLSFLLHEVVLWSQGHSCTSSWQVIPFSLIESPSLLSFNTS